MISLVPVVHDFPKHLVNLLNFLDLIWDARSISVELKLVKIDGKQHTLGKVLADVLSLDKYAASETILVIENDAAARCLEDLTCLHQGRKS
jgi:hypothetical protein